MEYYFGEKQVPTFLFSTRFGLAVLGFFGLLAMNSQRVVMDLALPCMLNHTAVGGSPVALGQVLHGYEPVMNTDYVDNSTYTTVEFVTANTSVKPENADTVKLGQSVERLSCGGAAIELDILKLKLNFTYSTKTGELVWPITRQNVLAQTFYWGYVAGFLPCGWMAERLGGKLILGMCIGAMSATTSLISLSTTTHYFVLILLRFIAGIGAGACLPAMHSIWGKWAPPLERSKLNAISFCGVLIGRTVTFPLVGALCQYGFLGGWPSVFYVLGAYGIIWAVLWLLCTKNFPNQHGRISLKEKAYLEATLAHETILNPRQDISVPCFAIVTSLPFLSVIISHFTFVWTLHTYEVYIPIYFSEILDYEYRENGFFNMIPYLGMCVFLTLSGMWADQLRSRGVMGTAAARKIMNTIGSSVPAAMLIGLGFINCTQWIGAVCMLTIGMSFIGFQGSGFFVNHLDLAPQYAGFLMGVSGCIGSLAVFVEPYLVETLTPENTHEQWQTVFFIAGCLGIFGGLWFLFCGSGEIQSWAKVDGYTSTCSTPNLSNHSSMESLDSASKVNAEKKSVGLSNQYEFLYDSKHMLSRSLSVDANKRYNVNTNGVTYDDPYYFRSLDRGSRKKLLASNPSYHSLEYPSKRAISRTIDPELRRTKGFSMPADTIIELEPNPSAAHEVAHLQTQPKPQTTKRASIERKVKSDRTSKQPEDSVDDTTLQRKSRSPVKSTIQDDPPSGDKPSTSSSGDSHKRSVRRAKKAKRSTSATLPGNTYNSSAESKV